MREQVITWYTPEEKIPEERRDLFINNLHGTGEFIEGVFYMSYDDGFDEMRYRLDLNNIIEWAYTNTYSTT